MKAKVLGLLTRKSSLIYVLGASIPIVGIVLAVLHTMSL